MPEFEPRDPAAEATAVLPDLHVARVLEPSPPADTDPDWWADDPTAPARAGTAAGTTIVSPTGDGDRTWTRLAVDDEAIATFARRHWLGPHHRLTPLPDGFATTRDALHQVAYFVVSPWRHQATGKLGLRWTRDGFGTPFQPGDQGDEQVRVVGDRVVHQQGGTVRVTTIERLSQVAGFLDMAYEPDWFADFHDPLAPVDPDQPLSVDPSATDALGAWFGFATGVLEALRRTPGASDVTRVQLWPEHLDPAVELGAGDARASYGASPGDDDHPRPYLYVAPWTGVPEGSAGDPFWNAEGFTGAELGLDVLLDADDQHASAVSFLAEAHQRLQAG